ncbi:hypothetical protein [Aliiroseovarius halocynthiae]|uniref:Uncharacterized protein n=1 Tax=Aliiroseovarius halocynthiae TaxID=985055 RepID=A0A545SSP5_9RHOB|nr:hypothetical protein [Aliiroseovarius halocynthiae]TQV67955.1 hypothetical protein FIL88_08945 [Aliiroseovarius halocynthiae]
MLYDKSREDYAGKASKSRNNWGDHVVDYEIQFSDGDQIDCELAKAWEINQANTGPYFEDCESRDILETHSMRPPGVYELRLKHSASPLSFLRC